MEYGERENGNYCSEEWVIAVMFADGSSMSIAVPYPTPLFRGVWRWVWGFEGVVGWVWLEGRVVTDLLIVDWR